MKRIFGAAIAILLSVTLIFGIEVNSASATDIQADCDQPVSPAEVPIGTITAYGGVVTGSDARDLESQGWLVCDGEEHLTRDYEELYCKIGVYFGTPSRPGYFRVPDLRGRFVRGVDNGTGRDPDAADRTVSATGGNTGDRVGSFQEDAFKAHTHNFKVGGQNGSGHYNTVGVGSETNIQDAKMIARGGSETRPINVYVNWIIKAKDIK
ncbi:MAG: tail fiber protein [Okeania sp. SIO3I5]|uniref:phage tail protein n=1 Tax=Okeania sp. SIO3I5 TaxID=2607805 RepID=UPI0013B60AA4|nr:phage tail protein [Okeania sp. SIO3I5]NEQ38787.1 tail fiber protein [Okeania sp. SIO3I5]